MILVRLLLSPILLILLASTGLAQAPKTLQVSRNGRYLQESGGKPFFYLGDTAWQMAQRLNREEAERYLLDRASKGFTVIQMVVLAELGGPDTPNAYGDLPLLNRNPATPNEAYFRHLDFIVTKANELGLVIGMLPTWGSHWKQRESGPPPIFDAANARTYGEFLGKRYRNRSVIWILGGDHNVDTPSERAVIDSLAAGLEAGDGGTHLITFHPRGPGLSSTQLNDATWLDFHMVQSSHAGRGHDNGLYMENDRTLKPARPTLDGEPRYEGINVGFYFDGFSRIDRFDDADVRQAAYWAMLAGACGHTYGNNNVWQMWTPDRKPAIGANIPWYDALNHPGAVQMGYLRRLFESRPWQLLEPKQDLILSGPRDGGAKIRAAVASDKSFAFVYSPKGEAFTVNESAIRGRTLRQTWWDPRYGVSYVVHRSDTKGIQTYSPPTSGRGQDWLLILEDDAAGYPANIR